MRKSLKESRVAAEIGIISWPDPHGGAGPTGLYSSKYRGNFGETTLGAEAITREEACGLLAFIVSSLI